MGEFLVPFAGRNESYSQDVNFLWNSDNIYIMDNHRVAAWCWAQHVKTLKKFSFLHIDYHWDCAPGRAMNISLLEGKLEDYLDAETTDSADAYKLKMYRWDNFIEPFFDYARDKIDYRNFAVQQDASDGPQDIKRLELILPADLSSFSVECYTKSPLIIDVDMDYFIADDGTGRHFRMFSKEYSEAVWRVIRNARDQNCLAVLTIALSPDCCGGWPLAEQLCSELCQTVGIDFKLPQ